MCAASQPSWSGRAGAIRAVIAATKTIPIVVSFGGDPVKLGYVASLNHPGGNVTGVSVFSTDLEAKRLELINEVVPQGEIIGYLSDPEFEFADVGRREVETAARRIGRDIRIVEVSKDADLEKAFATVAEPHVGGVLIAANASFNNLRDHILALATRLKLPAVYEQREVVAAGGLMSYGTNVPWLNPTRMHVFTHLSEKYENMRTAENGWTLEEAGMVQLDDVVGAVMQKLKDLNIDNNTILVFSTDNGAENFTWPDGGQTRFAGGKGTAMEGGFRVPCMIRWPGRVPAGKVENGITSGLDWFPTFVAAAGNPNIIEELLKGKQLGDRSYKVHLDGYNQLDFITGKAPSARHEVYYFTEGTFGAVRVNDFKYRFIDQPNGWFGGTVKVDWADPCQTST